MPLETSWTAKAKEKIIKTINQEAMQNVSSVPKKIVGYKTCVFTMMVAKRI